MLYNEFLKRNVARLDSQFTKPPMVAKGKLILPFNSVYHTSEEGFGIFGAEDDILSSYKAMITVENIFGLYPGVEHGKIRVRAFSKDNLSMEFNRNNKQYERFASAQGRLAKTPRLLHVVNYGNMLHHVIQLDEPQKEYHAYLNYWKSFFGYIAERTTMDNRHHFFKIETPMIVPPKSILNRVKEKALFSITEVGYFIDQMQMLMVEFWRFMQLNMPEVSELSMFAGIKEENLKRVHVILDLSTHYAVINLGLLHKWIKSDTNKQGKWKPEEAQNRFLKLLINCADFRTNTHSEDSEEEQEDSMNDVLGDLADGEDDSNAELNLEPEEVEKLLERAEVEVEETKKPRGGFYKKPVQKDLVSSQPNLAASIRESIAQDEQSEFLADNLDQELEELEAQSKTLNEDLSEEEEKQLEAVQEQAVKNQQIGDYQAYTPESTDLADSVKLKAKDIASQGLMTSAELRRFEKLSSQWENIKAPDGKPLKEFLVIDPKDKVIENDIKVSNPSESILDPTYLESSLKKMDKVYVEKFMDKHIHQMVVTSLQREGMVVKDIKRTHVKTLLDDYYQYSVKIIPVTGQESTVNFKVPKVSPDGTMTARGVKMRMRKQRGDLPVRKLSSDKVAMTSYHSKLFVTRSSRMVNNVDKWLVKKIYEATLMNPPLVSDLVYGDVFDPDLRSPRIHSGIAKTYTSFSCGDKLQYQLNFDHTQFKPENIIEHKVKKGEQPCGYVNGKLIVIDDLGILTWVKGESRGIIGTLESLIGVPEGETPPIEMIDVGPIAGKTIPLGFLLGYYIGLGNLLKTLDVPYRRINKGQRMNLVANELPIRFADQTLIVKPKDPVSRMLINGFNRYKTEINNINIWEFDKRDGYEHVLDLTEIRTRHLQRLQQIRTNWIDPITYDILIEMKYPVDMILLFIEAAKLLEYDDHPDENDIAYSRVRGYERISGMVYSSMMNALSDYGTRPNNPNAKVTMNPEEVWYAITTDQSTAPVDDSNPLQSVKDRSVVVFSGQGGRSGQTMTGKHRRYHKSGVGVISTDTVDSGDVATITYLTANPQFNSIYGTSGELSDPNKNAAATLSESTLLYPGAKYDD